MLVSPHMCLDDALKVMDAGGQRLALVIDGEHKLVGILTDGDVRRALLNRVNFESATVSDVMQASPHTALSGSSRDTLLQIMKQHDILHVPIVDSNGRLIGLETYYDMLQGRKYDNWVFLMAGGFGTRLKPLTDNCPKPMLQVGGKPMLETIIEKFISAGFHRFYISVHYLAEIIKDYFGDGSKWGVTIQYIEEDEPLGTGGALGLLPTADELPIIMMNGDILTNLNMDSLLHFHEDQGVELTMCVREYELQIPFGVVKANGASVFDILEKPVHHFFVNAGIYVISPSVLDRMIPPRRLDMPDLMKEIIVDECGVSMFPIHEYWLDIGRPEDFDRAQRKVNCD
ncbi:nucleotidyltransferase family protein [Chromobacterium violaceum]|uniref:nucleotidyltransferase family protein n=1 Tax=Chromobacterium violaceum TaxID=536 RepID=UPI001E4053B7|nr:nucleotidyltransferase family protein [Chromobacterium violaceum]